MRLNEGDEVAGIAVFRQGLAEQRAMSDNAEAGPDPIPMMPVRREMTRDLPSPHRPILQS